jgi:hypothetical protein
MSYTDGSKIISTVFLVCKPDESFKVSKLNDTSFLFYIESPCVCPGKCTYTPDKPPNSLSGGAIFLIIFICIIATYLIVGVLFLRFVKHEQGVNLIPNRSLWVQTGRDSIGGVRFLWTKLMRGNTYEKV